jgi:protein-S-isoprenylcysteine O-methyltransferase Ste14
MASRRLTHHPILSIPPAAPVAFSWRGRALEGRAGETIAAALVANGERVFGHHPRDGAPQGLFCAIGQCAQCLVLADGRPVKACLALALLSTISAIGGGVELVVLPYAAAAITLTVLRHDAFRWFFLPRALTIGAGLALAGAGVAFYAATVRLFLREFKTGKLITTGTFAWCRNPIYASFIVFFAPAAGLLADSWLIFSLAAAIYAVLKIFIREEDRELEAAFGDEYRRYAARVNEVLPIPPARPSKAGTGGRPAVRPTP